MKDTESRSESNCVVDMHIYSLLIAETLKRKPSATFSTYGVDGNDTVLLGVILYTSVSAKLNHLRNLHNAHFLIKQKCNFFNEEICKCIGRRLYCYLDLEDTFTHQTPLISGLS